MNTRISFINQRGLLLDYRYTIPSHFSSTKSIIYQMSHLKLQWSTTLINYSGVRWNRGEWFSVRECSIRRSVHWWNREINSTISQIGESFYVTIDGLLCGEPPLLVAIYNCHFDIYTVIWWDKFHYAFWKLSSSTYTHPNTHTDRPARTHRHPSG